MLNSQTLLVAVHSLLITKYSVGRARVICSGGREFDYHFSEKAHFFVGIPLSRYHWDIIIIIIIIMIMITIIIIIFIIIIIIIIIITTTIIIINRRIGVNVMLEVIQKTALWGTAKMLRKVLSL